jgi:hypothetical protein
MHAKRSNSAAVSFVDRRRVTYLALALTTIVVGLVVHFGGRVLAPAARDILGDALWAAMIVWWVGVIAPRANPPTRYGIAYAICAVVELSQAYHTPGLDAARANRLGQLVLGSGFDPRDLIAYAIGVGAAALLDATIIRRQT